MKISAYWVALAIAMAACPAFAAGDYDDDVAVADGSGSDGDDGTSGEHKRVFAIGDGMLEWDEYYDKERSAGVRGEGLRLECKKDKLDAITYTSLPLNCEEDFTVEAEFIVSEINDKQPFGVVFNMKDDANYDMMLFQEDRFAYVVVEDGETVQSKTKGKSRPDKIKLKGGKKQKVSFKMESRGEKLRFTVNGNDEFYRRTPTGGSYRSRDFGFYVSGKMWLDVTSLALTQDLSEQESND